MLKLDSFIRESQRWNPLDAGKTLFRSNLSTSVALVSTTHAKRVGSMARRVSKDFTFSNGLRIPAGNWIFAPNSPVLCDPKAYPEPNKFDGFRFYNLGQQDGPQSRNYTLVSSSMSNLQFGDGRHGW